MNIKKIFAILCLLVFSMMTRADASKLPEDVWNFIRTNLPQARQRFDSVITLKNDIMYIPLYPPADSDVEKIDIDYTYPSGVSLKSLPEVVLLNNGYAFLKVFKDSDGNYTLTKKDDLPIKVRLGLMPQDMLTPIGLKMPESLKLTLGDLLIPTKEETAITRLDDNSKNPYSPAVKRNEFVPAAEFQGKKTFINPKNSKFLEVYDNSSATPLYELKLTNMPKKIIAKPMSDIAVVLYWNSKEVDVINLKDENIIAKISIDDIPSDGVIDKRNNLAYITASKGQAIYLIDLNSMSLKKVIKLDQKPSKITYCETDDTISFFDEYKALIFNMTKNGNEYVVAQIGETNNLSSILSDVANIYGISRTDSALNIFDKTTGKLISTIELDKKPTDAIIYNNKIYILCSKEGYIDVFDIAQNKLISKAALDKNEFYSKITGLSDTKNVIITGLDANSYLIYNLDEMKITKKQDSYINVSNIVIINKNQSL